MLKEKIEDEKLEREKLQKEKDFLAKEVEEKVGKDELEEKQRALDDLKDTYEKEIKALEDRLEDRENEIEELNIEKDQLNDDLTNN